MQGNAKMTWTQAKLIILNHDRYDRSKQREAAITIWRSLPWSVRLLLLLNHFSPVLADKLCTWRNSRRRARR